MRTQFKITDHTNLHGLEIKALRAYRKISRRLVIELFKQASIQQSAAQECLRKACGDGKIALSDAAETYWGYDWQDLREIIMARNFGIRLYYMVKEFEALNDLLVTICEEYGDRESRSAADCYEASCDSYSRAEWECQHMERWYGD
jgi:hypothetical protein